MDENNGRKYAATEDSFIFSFLDTETISSRANKAIYFKKKIGSIIWSKRPFQDITCLII